MSESILITDAKIITPSQVIEDGWLHLENGTIQAIGNSSAPSHDNSQVINAQGKTLLPGLIDVHVHGAMGHDTMDASADGLQAMARFYAQHGVTSFLATTWTETQDRITNALDTIRQNVGQIDKGATLLGAHLEGPYLNPAKAGAQNPEYIRRADQDEAIAWLDKDVIRLLSLASEYEENHWLISECVQRGITVSCAHTNGTAKDIEQAVELGLSHATHTYNAMTGLHHRKPGVLGAVMNNPAIRCELIADDIHVHPIAMSLLWKAKGKDGVILISDAISATGLDEGEHLVDGRPVIIQDGAVRLSDGNLAGSILTMEKALYNFSQAIDEPLENIWQTASLNPAKALGIDQHKGSLEVGKNADVVLLDEHDYQVCLTIAEGRIVYQEER